ncbi:PopZ family protein [Afifella sp. IM 167]|uniref:PopZ family protein n=1 Tax=Afifella sp. IM 167 TaxID=2033586 RepID=UPI00271544F5|nr:DUF2497 domain-containing protein [Afifella sp. IM 167]MBZ8132574.1 hypothetical protein [Afifella sp. IM 167]
MGNPSAAHEPTMEEILASIRQIISEDGDKGQVKAAKSFRVPPEEEQEMADEAAPEAFAEPAPEAVEEDDDFPDFSMAGPAAEEPVAAEPAADEPAPYEPVETPAPRDDTPTSHAAPAQPEAAAVEDHKEPAPVHDEPEPAREEPAPAWEQPAPHAGFAAFEQPSRSPEAASHATARASAGAQNASPERGSLAAYQAQPSHEDERLLSPDSDEAVAGAFSALANTILSKNSRTLEDLVSDMLRPMLRDWLDENLPPLVERLVREEIERVSRGRR